MPVGNLGRNSAGFPVSDAAKGIGRRKCREVCSGRGPACQHGRLCQQEHQRHSHHHHQGKAGRQNCPGAALPAAGRGPPVRA
jgi:hypothetical protein